MISKEKFEDYERVRKSGVTNMFDTDIVSQLTGLTKEEIIEIMKNYSSLNSNYFR